MGIIDLLQLYIILIYLFHFDIVKQLVSKNIPLKGS